MSCPGDWPDGRLSFPLDRPVPLPEGPVELAVEVDDARQRFFWRAGGDWTPIGPELDASLISDEAGRGEHASFTGAFVGMAAFDTSGRAARPTSAASATCRRRDDRSHATARCRTERALVLLAAGAGLPGLGARSGGGRRRS